MPTPATTMSLLLKAYIAFHDLLDMEVQDICHSDGDSHCYHYEDVELALVAQLAQEDEYLKAAAGRYEE